MKRLWTMTAGFAAGMALSGCGTLDLMGLARQAAFPAAAAVETRVGANCIRAAEAGRPASAVGIYRLQNGRDVFDAMVASTQSANANTSLGRIRERTDGVCPPLPPRVTAPLEAALPDDPPAP